ncbi:trigger factor, partial [bacterium]
SSVTKKLTVEITAEEFKKEEASTFAKFKRNVAIPGFRKGKAPESAVKRMFGERIKADVFNDLINKTYPEALKETGADPVAEPNVNIEKIEEDGSMTYTAELEVRPDVAPVGFEGLSLKKEAIKVDQVDIDAKLENLRAQFASLEPVEEGHAAASGDFVRIDFKGASNGEAFDGGSADNFPLLLGSGRMIAGFEKGIEGAKVGDQLSIDVTFPESYHVPALAGKPAVFEVKVHEIKARVLPEINADLAKQSAGVETVEELRDRVAEAIKAEESNRVEREFRAKLISVLLEANPFDVPPSVVERQKEHSINRTRQDLSMRGIDPVAIGVDSPAFAEEARKAAVRTVRWIYLRDAIAEAVGIKIEKADIDKRIEEIAAADGRPVESIRKFFDNPQHMMTLFDNILEERTLAAITEKASIEE